MSYNAENIMNYEIMKISTTQIQVEVVKWYVMKIISQLKSAALDKTVCN